MGKDDAETSETEDDALEFDITPCALRLVCCCLGSQRLRLEPEEAVLLTSTPLSSDTKRVPYGELGDVTHSIECGICHSFNSNLSPMTDKGRQPIAPGCGCSGELVKDIVDELKARMKGRGNTGNIRRAEDVMHLLGSVKNVFSLADRALDAVLSRLGVAAPPSAGGADCPHLLPSLAQKQYTVTGCGLKYCCCGSETLVLDAEEAYLETRTLCSTSKKRMPYGSLSFVTSQTCCGGCHAVHSELGLMSPGCGCQRELVAEIVEELTARQRQRGDTGNIQLQEQTNNLVHQATQSLLAQDAKVDALLRHYRIPQPVPPQQSMGAAGVE